MREQAQDKRREQHVRSEREKEEKRLERLGWTYVNVTGFVNRKLRRQARGQVNG